MLRDLKPGEEIFVRNHSDVYNATVVKTRHDIPGSPVVPQIERRFSPNQLQSRADCYPPEERRRLIGDLQDLQVAAEEQWKKIQAIVVEEEMSE